MDREGAMEQKRLASELRFDWHEELFVKLNFVMLSETDSRYRTFINRGPFSKFSEVTTIEKDLCITKLIEHVTKNS